MTGAGEEADAGPAHGDRPPPLVSVIIPTWNRAPTLRLTLATVLAQDLADCEVLVIGDGCTDESEAVVASCADPRLRWHNLPLNSGSAVTPTNAGLRLARGRYVAHLGHDDFWFPWHLSGLVATIEATAADWVYSLVVAVGPNGIRHCTGPPQRDVPDAEHHVPPSGWLYRREVIADVGWWAEPDTIPWPFDFDYMRRAALAGKRFACHRRPSALKFPSSLFPDGYRTGEPSPVHLDYFARLRDEPEALERETLIELATRFAQLDRGGGKGVFARQPPTAGVRQSLMWSTRRWLIAHYGAQRWPLPQLLGGAFQRRRVGRLHLRGLDGQAATAPPAPLWPGGDPARRLVLRAERRERRRLRGERAREEREVEGVQP